MKSTGECLGIAESFNEALYKAFLGAGINLPKYKNMIITVRMRISRISYRSPGVLRHWDTAFMQPEALPES